MRTKTNQSNKILRQGCDAEAPQKEKILRPEYGVEAPTFLSAVYKRGTQAKKRQAYAPQYGRLLSLCAGDAPQVSNDVYNQRYTSEKLASRSKQSGRSMIEMLGVLAIIGVLTVGSIAGYSHAMRRHLLNKQREQYSYILSAVETNYDTININTPNLPDHFTSVLKTFGWIPEEMIKDNGIHIYDVLKNAAHFYKWKAYMGLMISLATPNAYEQCTNLYQVMKQYHTFLWATEVRKQNDGAKYGPSYYGDQYCTGNLNCIRDLTPTKISQLCQFCNDTEDNYCHLYILWK